MAANDFTLSKSVTAKDIPEDASPYGLLRGNRNFSLNFWFAGNGVSVVPILPDLPEYYSRARDFALSRTPLLEGSWSSAVAIAITKISSLNWSVEGDIPLQNKRAQELFLTPNGGAGWTHFLSQHLRDFLCTDNGAFIEVVRSSSGAGSTIIGLVHLDSRRCMRTGMPESPVIYLDNTGAQHLLKDYQVIMLSDMPNPGETFFGVGLCAASRAYDSIQMTALYKAYQKEKMSGRKPLSVNFLSGINDESVSGRFSQS
jgi:hypothetical protein